MGSAGVYCQSDLWETGNYAGIVKHQVAGVCAIIGTAMLTGREDFEASVVISSLMLAKPEALTANLRCKLRYFLFFFSKMNM